LRQARHRDTDATTVMAEPIRHLYYRGAPGADGITVHLREDRRHIQGVTSGGFANAGTRLNLEMAARPRDRPGPEVEAGVRLPGAGKPPGGDDWEDWTLCAVAIASAPPLMR
jgi:hypothetical protein